MPAAAHRDSAWRTLLAITLEPKDERHARAWQRLPRLRSTFKVRVPARPVGRLILALVLMYGVWQTAINFSLSLLFVDVPAIIIGTFALALSWIVWLAVSGKLGWTSHHYGVCPGFLAHAFRDLASPDGQDRQYKAARLREAKQASANYAPLALLLLAPSLIVVSIAIARVPLDPQLAGHAHASPVTEVMFAADDRAAVTISSLGLQLFHDPATGRLERRYHRSIVYASGRTVFSPDGQSFLALDYRSSSSGSPVALVDTATGQKRHRLGLVNDGQFALGFAFSSDGERVFTCDRGSLEIWATETGELLQQFVPSYSEPVPDHALRQFFAINGFFGGFAVSPDDRKIFVIVMREAFGLTPSQRDRLDGTRLLYVVENYIIDLEAESDSALGVRRRVFESHPVPPADEPGLYLSDSIFALERDHNVVSFSPDGQRILAVDRQGPRLMDLRTDSAMPALEAAPDSIASIRFAPDGKTVIAAVDNAAMLWDAESGRVLRRFPHDSAVLSAAVSHDGLSVLTGSEDGAVRMLDANTGSLLWQHRLRSQGPVSVIAAVTLMTTILCLLSTKLFDPGSWLWIWPWQRNPYARLLDLDGIDNYMPAAPDAAKRGTD